MSFFDKAFTVAAGVTKGVISVGGFLLEQVLESQMRDAKRLSKNENLSDAQREQISNYMEKSSDTLQKLKDKREK